MLLTTSHAVLNQQEMCGYDLGKDMVTMRYMPQGLNSSILRFPSGQVVCQAKCD